MGFFSKNNTASQEQDTGEQQQSSVSDLNIEVHTMPKKFLGLKPQGDGTSRSAVASVDRGRMDQAPASPIKKRLIVSIIVIVVVGLVMAIAAFIILKVVNKSPENQNPENTVVNSPVVTPPVVNPPITPDTPTTTTSPVVTPPVVEETVNAPSQITFTNVSENSLRVQWIDNSDNELGFRLYRSTTDAFSDASIVSTISANILNLTMSGLECSTEYFFWVESFISTTSSRSLPNSVSTTQCPTTVLPPTIQFDSDSDLLTIKEETMFGTDVDQADTDKDGYVDGQELLNLFDPRFADGALLADSNSVRTFISNEYGYRLLVPVGWQESLVGGDDDQVRFIGEDQEFVEVLIEDNVNQYSSALEWYTSQFSSIPAEDLGSVNAQGVSGIVSPDGLTSYILTSEYIYVITYNPGLDQQLNYLTTYRMIVRSFGLFEDPLQGL